MKTLFQVKYLGESSPFYFLNGKIYDVVGIESHDLFRIIDETGEDYCYSLNNFKLMSPFQVRFVGESKVAFEHNEIYDVIGKVDNHFKIVDESGEPYLYSLTTNFEII